METIYIERIKVSSDRSNAIPTERKCFHDIFKYSIHRLFLSLIKFVTWPKLRTRTCPLLYRTKTVLPSFECLRFFSFRIIHIALGFTLSAGSALQTNDTRAGRRRRRRRRANRRRRNSVSPRDRAMFDKTDNKGIGWILFVGWGKSNWAAV